MIALAYKEAKKSRCKYKHGAVITKSGCVVSTGFNANKAHPTWGSGPMNSIHAEGAAIRNAVRKGINVRGAKIYVTRNKGISRMSRPCSDCMKLIEKYGIKKIIYTDIEGNVITEWP